jgi:signal transduction histidine kinase/DNA-binding NarL/FixJ family response regulator
MLGTQGEVQTATADHGRRALDVVHRLLMLPAAAPLGLNSILAELAAAFEVPAAGLATLPEGAVCVRHPAAPNAALPPLGADLLATAQRRAVAITLPLPTGSVLAAVSPAAAEASHSGWLLWLEADRAAWSPAEPAALVLAVQTIGRFVDAAHLAPECDGPLWVEQLDRAVKQQRLEQAAEWTRRLAHDFGNVLTGILGFSELALGQQVPHHSVLHNYLNEVHRGARSGAQFLQQLRLFARRKVTQAQACSVSAALAEEQARLRQSGLFPAHCQVDLPEGLPPVGLDAGELRGVLGPVLDNACEAIAADLQRVRPAVSGGPAELTITARTITLSDEQGRDLFGDLQAGPHVELLITDCGVGITPEAQQRLFREPFFSTKSRRRGFGLIAVYGALFAHKGGIDLRPGPEGGTQVRIVLPLAPVGLSQAPADSSADSLTPPQQAPIALNEQVVPRRRGRSSLATAPAGPPDSLRSRGKERILIVDDEPGILLLAAELLEQAGYRVEQASSGEAALEAHAAAADDPFHLVLSDVLMPGMNGVAMVRQLMARDASARIVFMSGQVSREALQDQLCGLRFELLAKPFTAEALLRLMQAVLQRCPPGHGGDKVEVIHPSAVSNGLRRDQTSNDDKVTR